MDRKRLIIAGLAALLLCNLGIAAYILLSARTAQPPSPTSLALNQPSAGMQLPPSWTATPEALAAILPTDSPLPTSAAKQVQTFVVGSAEAAAAASESESAQRVNRLMDEQYHVRITTSEPLLWGTGWCASSPAILDANFRAMEPQLFVNGETISSERYAVRDYGNPDPDNRTYCRSHFVLVESWPVGSTTLKACYLIREAVNDGWSDYSPGYSCTNFTVDLVGS
jgi:hypothetical protein